MDKDRYDFVHAEVPLWMTFVFFVIFTIAGVGFFSYFNRTGYTIKVPGSSLISNQFQYGANAALANANYFGQVKSSFISSKAEFIEADLSNMIVRVYKDGAIVEEVPIKTKGREGSWWETPAGLYKVESKESNHFSSIGKVYQPYSMAFQGNFFIHGWPYHSDGTEVASTYSGGCIRLTTEDAKKIYALVSVGTPVLVFEKDFAEDSFTYTHGPELTADRYLVADLKSNSVILEKGLGEKASIASISKLVTGLVAAEYIDLEKGVRITESMIASTSKPRLKPGDETTVYNLMFPLLMESSNEAAEAIARPLGRDRFIGLMNDKAMAIGMKNTTFADPSGVSAYNISTAEDLFALAKYIYNNRSFLFKITTGNLTTSAYGKTTYQNLSNFNLIPTVADTFIGGKIGKGTQAGETYLGVFEVTIKGEKRQIAVIILHSDELYSDMNIIFNYINSVYP
ncbi:L,D-transpeptidase family protein [Candidatus Parcubacteria bacterium]|nr:L,D-transpeptidase family protein [Candidatus Parcubacteria bacterium]